MDGHLLIQWAAALTGLFFFVALGAIVGSFINVLVYRLPRGLNVVTPPSACPACGTRLTWRQNIPILGWILLRGRCRFCRSPISPEYPLVELAVALVFALLWTLWFMYPSPLPFLGMHPHAWRPDFAAWGVARMWPTLLIALVLISSLVAATLVDARTFMIPLVLPWVAGAVGVLTHTLHAAWIGARSSIDFSPHLWTIPAHPGWRMGLALGATLGLVVSNLLLRAGLIRQSFADYAQWEASAREAEKQRQSAAASTPASTPSPAAPRSIISGVLLLTGPAIALMLFGFSLGMSSGHSLPFATIGGALGLILGLVLRRAAPSADHPDSDEDPIWVRYPHTRREMLRELAFLAPPISLGLLGAWLASPSGLLGGLAASPPLWMIALAGSLLGLIVGGALVWGVRLLGSLALGKEAMGLGDVHLMAAAGACVGWIDVTLAFFVAPFLGIAWAVLSVFSRQLFHRAGTALPYGPHLAAATIAVMLFKPVFETALSALAGWQVNLP
ncbi:MAG: A24 family peptidase [Planctomycetota bacterium]|nr:A24 family peptidase [Planctomycetota bacterium]